MRTIRPVRDPAYYILQTHVRAGKQSICLTTHTEQFKVMLLSKFSHKVEGNLLDNLITGSIPKPSMSNTQACHMRTKSRTRGTVSPVMC